MKLLEILQHACASSYAEEIDALDQLRKIFRPKDDALGEDDVEHQWLSIAAGSLGDDEGPHNPFPANTPDTLFSSQSDLDRLAIYFISTFIFRLSYS